MQNAHDTMDDAVKKS